VGCLQKQTLIQFAKKKILLFNNPEICVCLHEIYSYIQQTASSLQFAVPQLTLPHFLTRLPSSASVQHSWHATSVLYTSVSQPPGRGPVPGPGINYIGPREILLELVSNLNVILYLSTCHIVRIIVLILFMIKS